MLNMDRHTKVPTVTSSSDLPLRGQGKSKFENISNGKNNNVDMLSTDRHAEVFTLTLLSDLPLKGQRSKKVKICNYFK